MKASAKLQDDGQSRHQHTQPHAPPVLLRAKIPITIFNLPFLSHFSTTTTHPSDLSLSLSTNFPSGPSLKLSYATTTSSAAAAATPPLTLTLKSGTGLFGSPNNSPLVVNAHFSFNPSNPNHPNPTFSLMFKPNLGSFSLRKTIFSHKKSDISNKPDNGDSSFETNSFGFVPLERPSGVKDFELEGNNKSDISNKPDNGDSSFGTNSFGFVPLERPLGVKNFEVERNKKDSIFKGISVMARTQMLVANRVALTCRWNVNFPEDFEKKMPYLKVNKIGIERVDQALKEEKKKGNEGNVGDLDMLKGMYFWMKRELDVLQRENRELKCELEGMKVERMVRNSGSAKGSYDSIRKIDKPAVDSPSDFKQWRNKKSGGGEENDNVNGNGNGKKEANKNGVSVRASDVENELERAIKAAAAS